MPSANGTRRRTRSPVWKSILRALDLVGHDLCCVLEGVHNGSEASLAFEKMKEMQHDELQACRENLLKYCDLDTLAMIKVWEKLCEAVE